MLFTSLHWCWNVPYTVDELLLQEFLFSPSWSKQVNKLSYFLLWLSIIRYVGRYVQSILLAQVEKKKANVGIVLRDEVRWVKRRVSILSRNGFFLPGKQVLLWQLIWSISGKARRSGQDRRTWYVRCHGWKYNDQAEPWLSWRSRHKKSRPVTIVIRFKLIWCTFTSDIPGEMVSLLYY